MLCAVCALFSACAVSAAPSGILPQMYKIRAGTGKGRTGEGIRRQSEAVVRRKREQDRERRWGGISRRIGKTAAARARSALFPQITLLKQRNSKLIPPKYPYGAAVRFYPVQTGFRTLPAAGQAESQNEAKNGTHGHPVKKAPCGRGKPNTVRNGVRHARCVI